MAINQSPYQELLAKVQAESPYNTWKEVMSGCYRDYSGGEENPKQQLSQYGLYDYSLGKVVKTLPALARELGLGSAVRTGKRLRLKVGDRTAAGEAMEKKLQVIQRRVEDEDRWLEKDWPAIQKYFQDQRGISLSPDFYRKELNAIYQQYKHKESGEQVSEIVVPLYGIEGELVQLQKIQVEPETGAKVGKKLQGRSEGRDRAVMLGAKEAAWCMVFEGLEDALSAYQALTWQARKEAREAKEKTGEKGGEAGKCLWAICAVMGTSGYSRVKGLLAGYGRVVVCCDNDKDGQGVKGSLALGDLEGVRIQRFCHPTVGLDCNAALVAGGVEGAWSWLEEIGKSPVTFEQLKVYSDQVGSETTGPGSGEAIEETPEAKEERRQARRKPKRRHWEQNPLCDDAAAGCFLDVFKDVVRYSEDGRWWVWQENESGGGVWQSGIGVEGRILDMISSLHLDYMLEFKRRELGLSDAAVKKWQSWITSLGNYRTQRGIMAKVAGHGSISCRVEDFDANPAILNVINGVLDLKTGRLSDAKPEFMCSRQAAVRWEEGIEWKWQKNGKELPESPIVIREKPVRFLQFLSEICDGQERDRLNKDPEKTARSDMMAYIQRCLGYCISGYTGEKALFFWEGEGDNGKSCLGNIVRGIMGSYYQYAAADAFMERGKNGSGAQNEIAALAGARIVMSSETESGRRWSEPLLKQLTGGDVVTCRFLYKECFSYLPRYKIIIHGNNRPRIVGTDPAIWRRFQITPFMVSIPRDQQISGLDESLVREEGPAILAWMVAGFQAWHAAKENGTGEGLDPPVESLLALEDYKQDCNSLMQFIREECVPADYPGHGGRGRVPAGEFYKAFVGYCRERRFYTDIKSQKKMTKEMRKLKYETQESNGVTHYLNIELINKDLQSMETDFFDDSNFRIGNMEFL